MSATAAAAVARSRVSGGAPTSLAPNVVFDLTVEEAFPKVDPLHEPCQNLVLVQYPKPKTKTRSGLILAEETRKIVQANIVIVKVIAVGPVAFKNRETLVPWPEGASCAVGDFIRVGKYDPDKWEVPLGKNQEDGVVIFGLVDDTAIRAKVTGDPLSIVAYV